MSAGAAPTLCIEREGAFARQVPIRAFEGLDRRKRDQRYVKDVDRARPRVIAGDREGIATANTTTFFNIQNFLSLVRDRQTCRTGTSPSLEGEHNAGSPIKSIQQPNITCQTHSLSNS